ncbi:hypothetical protein [Mycolicibacterium poriferae]|jgi:hypothetical protein|uniref:hypothetical protein n=1 Tax=Mycolicibacterium poriferae TaxID=39694 RepID=UPI0024BA87CC|nr:hypothetical protein [Mycolicibacterium poriferae]
MTTVSLTCPACPEVLSIPITVGIKSGSSRRTEDGRGIVIGVTSEISAEGKRVIAEHAKAAHSD